MFRSTELKDSLATKPTDSKLDFTVQDYPAAPRQIQLEDMQDNGGFASSQDFEKAIAKIKEIEAKQSADTPKQTVQYSKKLLGTQWSYVHSADDKYYAIYYGFKHESKQAQAMQEPFKRILGKGNFGTVRVACDQAGTPFAKKTSYLFKAQEHDEAHKKLKELFLLARRRQEMESLQAILATHPRSKEYKNLMQMEIGKAHAYRVSPKPEKSLEEIILMDYVSGEELLDYLITHPKLPSHHLVGIVLGMLQSTDDLHEKHKLLHGDIGLENFLLDEATYQLKSVDFALSLNLEKPGQVIQCHGIVFGKEGNIAPEIRSKTEYSEKSDIYALGMCIGMCFGFAGTRKINPWESRVIFCDKADPWYTDSSTIPDIRVRSDIYDFIARMLNRNRDERPTRQECIQFFKEIEKKLLKFAYENVAITHMDELQLLIKENPTPDEQKQAKALIEALKTVDRVTAVETKRGRTKKEYTKIARKLGEQGILINKLCVKQGAEFLDVAAKIPDAMNAKEPEKIRHYFCVTSQCPQTKKSPLYVMHVKPERTLEHYTQEVMDYFKQQLLSQGHREVIIAKLQECEVKSEVDELTTVKALVSQMTKFFQETPAITYFQTLEKLTILDSALRNAPLDEPKKIPYKPAKEMPIVTKFWIMTRAQKIKSQIEQDIRPSFRRA